MLSAFAPVLALSGGQKIELLAFGVGFIVFALISSLVVPRRSPNFPGTHVGWYVVVVSCFFVAMLAAVLVLASDPYHYGGSWTAEACQKVVRWVDFTEVFHLPIVYLMDCPGFMIGLDAEKSATIRYGVRAMAAVNQTTVPWCTVIVRNSFGVAGVVHQPADRFSIRYAWPSAYWGSLPLEGGIEAAYRADLDAAEDRAAKLKEIEDRLNKLRSPFRSAEKFWVEEIIDPRKTRSLLCEFARLAEPLRTPGLVKNMTIRP